ncbi:MAG TPA: DnaJ domain-containing protein [Stellaceae bacterium]|nr:DnaJ domain-containing protein [Stellaceae bacterium]
MPELALLGGVVLLGGLLLLVYLFVNANPAKLARALKWIAIGAAVLIFLFLLLSERFAFLWTPLILTIPYWRRFRSIFGGFRGAGAGSQTSDVSTPYLRMSLDHDTGTMRGTVLAGRYAGAQLEEMGRGDLYDLLRECRTTDEEGARLLEAYLDRIFAGWRDEFAGGGTPGGSAPHPNSGEITVAEAYEILGLAPGADEAQIKAAHHRLMMQLHPDHGGTDYLATKINRARDVLLKH